MTTPFSPSFAESDAPWSSSARHNAVKPSPLRVTPCKRESTLLSAALIANPLRAPGSSRHNTVHRWPAQGQVETGGFETAIRRGPQAPRHQDVLGGPDLRGVV